MCVLESLHGTGYELALHSQRFTVRWEAVKSTMLLLRSVRRELMIKQVAEGGAGRGVSGFQTHAANI